MKHIGIVGAGTMGTGIAQVALTSGFSVVLVDIAEPLLGRAGETVRNELTKLAAKKLFPADQIEASLSRLRTSTSLQALDQCSIIIEAASEKLSIKQELFRTIENLSPADTILATNTSSLSITEIASAVQRRGNVVGMHFFNPPARMKLVEVVRGFESSEDTIERTLEFARLFGKTAIVVKDTPGFIVNRVARPFYGEALRILNEGIADVTEIDRIMRLEGGFKMGPFELMDLIGIDINFAVTQSIYEQTFHEPRYRPHIIQKTMVSAGLLGRKTGRGFYKYSS